MWLSTGSVKSPLHLSTSRGSFTFWGVSCHFRMNSLSLYHLTDSLLHQRNSRQKTDEKTQWWAWGLSKEPAELLSSGPVHLSITSEYSGLLVLYAEKKAIELRGLWGASHCWKFFALFAEYLLCARLHAGHWGGKKCKVILLRLRCGMEERTSALPLVP